MREFTSTPSTITTRARDGMEHRASRTFNTFHAKIEQKAKGTRRIAGWASVRAIDRDDMIVEPEAFRNSSGVFMAKNPILLFNHDRNKPIGVVKSLEIREHGVWVEAEISKTAEDTWTMIEEGVLNAFSVRYLPEDAVHDRDGVKHITLAELLEISVVTIPAGRETVFSVVKSFDKGTDLQCSTCHAEPCACAASAITSDVKDGAGASKYIDENGMVDADSLFAMGMIRALNDCIAQCNGYVAVDGELAEMAQATAAACTAERDKYQAQFMMPPEDEMGGEMMAQLSGSQIGQDKTPINGAVPGAAIEGETKMATIEATTGQANQTTTASPAQTVAAPSAQATTTAPVTPAATTPAQPAKTEDKVFDVTPETFTKLTRLAEFGKTDKSPMSDAELLEMQALYAEIKPICEQLGMAV